MNKKYTKKLELDEEDGGIGQIIKAWNGILTV